MLSNLDITSSYIELYSLLRQYIWDMDMIVDIVDLEDSVCVRFPDVKKVSNNIDKLIRRCKSMEDEELKDALLSFKKELDVRADEVFSYLTVNFTVD